MRAARALFLATSALLLASAVHGQVPTLEPQEQIALGGRSIEAQGDRVWVGDVSAAHLLRRQPGSRCDPEPCWRVQQSVFPPAFDPAFGQRITQTRNALVVSGGDPSGVGGGAYIHERQNGSFVFRQLLHEDLPLFGRTHALAGDYMVVNSHSVFSPLPVGPYLYHRTPSALWESLGLLASSAQFPDNFDQYGINAAMTRRDILVGADEGGYVAAFQNRDGVWEERQILRPWDVSNSFSSGFGRGIAIRDRIAVVGAYVLGAIYVFELRDGAWQQLQKLERWDDSQVMFFGHEVAYDGKHIAVMDREAIYVYQRREGVWSPKAKLVNSGFFSEDLPLDKLQFDGKLLYAVSTTGVWRYDLSALEGG